jgi:hypothetical protein
MFSGTAQVSHQVCQFFFVSSVYLRMTTWFRQVNWGNRGIPWVNCAVLCLKTTGKDSCEACAIVSQNCAVYSVFPSGVTSHAKIAQFNWECIAPFRQVSCVRILYTDCACGSCSRAVVCRNVSVCRTLVTDGIRIAHRPMESECKNENLNVLKVIFIHICGCCFCRFRSAVIIEPARIIRRAWVENRSGVRFYKNSA